MNRFPIGEIIRTAGLMEFILPDGYVLVWRESIQGEFIFIKDENVIPERWMRQQTGPLKILGEYKDIKKLFPVFQLPPGTKVIGLDPGAKIQIDSLKKILRFHGKRHKRVAIVDDSSTIRKLLKHMISKFLDWDIVAEIDSAEKIPEVISNFYPDLVTLDLNLGKLNGVQAMKSYLAPKRIPTLLITSQSNQDGGLVMDSIAAGALDYLQKPESGDWEGMSEDLFLKMDAALKAKWQISSSSQYGPSILKMNLDFNPQDYLIVIGSSTGGTLALQEVLARLPAKIPPILIAQHIPGGFSRALAQRLNELCKFEVKEAENGDEIKPNRVLIAPGEHHMRLSKRGNTVEVFAGEPVNRFRPSVDVLFNSVTVRAKVQVIGIILTGMGRDGAEGMLALKKAGAYTIAQDEASSVVFGMPKEAILIGAIDVVKPLIEIPEALFRYFSRQRLLRKSG